MKIKIEVTQKDIDSGVESDVEACPVWRGVRRVVKRGMRVLVDHISIDLRINGMWEELFTPQRAINFMKRFDDGRAVKPFSFDLDIPEDALKATVLKAAVKAAA